MSAQLAKLLEEQSTFTKNSILPLWFQTLVELWVDLWLWQFAKVTQVQKDTRPKCKILPRDVGPIRHTATHSYTQTDKH